MKIDKVVVEEKNDKITFNTGELHVKDGDPEKWEATLHGVENQRFFMEAMRDSRKEHLTFETEAGTMDGFVAVEGLDPAATQNVVTLTGASVLNGYQQ
ncbi:hypothetical protein J2S78_001310 [Salibacterium salarium]|uniref:Uncharacterized protein n=1 Tax=Salibacterium salarium TaxID=284579 RepID=A0A3R9WPN2_9BACI|nr:hypothetical protein [Salibacterium salarium]MDQ0298890.1 hypothetical protein [Salibacterium salarium]RSL30840.1 hypothetical protein D7Z54_23905 [Salibacterium salarium]